MNKTAQIIIERLGKKPLLGTADIAAAMGFANTRAIADAIGAGEIAAVKITNGQYIVAREEAERWILSLCPKGGAR